LRNHEERIIESYPRPAKILDLESGAKQTNNGPPRISRSGWAARFACTSSTTTRPSVSLSTRPCSRTRQSRAAVTTAAGTCSARSRGGRA
jgi:hypothetical protein